MLASTTSPACSAAWDTGLGCGAGTDPPGKHPVVRESRKHSNAWGTGGNPPYPTNPSSFSEGDWRHCYVGLEGPVVPSEKVLGSLKKNIYIYGLHESRTCRLAAHCPCMVFSSSQIHEKHLPIKFGLRAIESTTPSKSHQITKLRGKGLPPCLPEETPRPAVPLV